MSLIGELLHGKDALHQKMYESDQYHPITDEQLKKLQDCLKSIYLDVFQMCNENGIDLYMTGGAAIGALRHKGFIPWDDDIDCGIRRADYARFVEVFKKNLSDRYEINAPNVSEKATYRYTRILLKGTRLREIYSRPDDQSQMIGMDIFMIENVPDNKIRRFFKGARCNALEFISGQVALRENRYPAVEEFYLNHMKSYYKVKLFIGKIFSFRSASKWFEILDRAAQYPDEHSKDCSIVTGRKHYFGETAPREVYFPAATADFCGLKIKVFHDEDRYLKMMYGNYMELPPVEKRERHFLAELDFGDKE